VSGTVTIEGFSAGDQEVPIAGEPVGWCRRNRPRPTTL